MARVKNGMGHSRTAKTFQKESFRLSLESDASDTLRQLAGDLRAKALRPAAYAMAHEFYTEMKIKAPVYTGTLYLNKTGKMAGEQNAYPGQLRDSIYHWHDNKKSNEDRQIYAIGPNKKKAPHWYFLEFGTSRMAAKPYVRTAWLNKKDAAVSAGKTVLAEKIMELLNDRIAA